MHSVGPSIQKILISKQVCTDSNVPVVKTIWKGLIKSTDSIPYIFAEKQQPPHGTWYLKRDAVRHRSQWNARLTTIGVETVSISEVAPPVNKRDRHKCRFRVCLVEGDKFFQQPDILRKYVVIQKEYIICCCISHTYVLSF